MALEVLISVGGKVAELLVEPIGRRLLYIVRPKRNIPKLRIQVEKLEALRDGVQASIDQEIRNGQEIRADVTLWTHKVDELIKQAKMILQGGSNTNNNCLSRLIPNPATRYQQGKWAEEKTNEAGELLKEGNFTNISKPAPPLGIEVMPSGSADITYEATKSAMEKVMEALRDENINFIGIHGIGGVGKTTLVKDIGKKVKEDKLFDEVVMAVVSQNQDIRKIQTEIAVLLDLILSDEPSDQRARKLYTRIKEVRRILVILDDIWAKVDLLAVGIPFDDDHKGCKMIITTRREQVCRTMGMVTRRKTIALNVLSEEDSWHLFRGKASSVVDSPKLNATAKEVWKECGHLPLALVTVGSAMSGKDDLDDWKEAAKQLKAAAPHDIEGVEKHVYRSIKLSFDYLEDEVAQKLLLLCSLFPEDYDIEIEDLVRYGWGLRIFRDAIDTVSGARRRTKTVIKNLKEASLLLPTDKSGCIKMHDVVRDVAISIGSDKYIVSAGGGGRSLENWPVMGDHYEGISLMFGDEVGSLENFPNLKILILRAAKIVSSLSSQSLSKSKELNVLHLEKTYAGSLNAGHYDFSHQTCLRTLILRGIDGPESPDLSAIGKIITLEILDLQDCSFQESPKAYIRALTNLKVLDLRDTFHDYVKDETDDGVISPDLTNLEELYVEELSWDEFNTLRKLPRLKVLWACAPNMRNMPRDFVFPDQFECYHITLGPVSQSMQYIFGGEVRTLVVSRIEEPAYLWRGSLTTALLTKCVHLFMWYCDKVVSVCPDLTARADDLKLLIDLFVIKCRELRYIINTTSTDDGWDGVQPPPPRQQLLSSLEELKLWDLPRLEYLFKLSTTPQHPHHHQVVYLGNLKRVFVYECNSLRYLFQPAIAQTLVQLEQLIVVDCWQLEEIVADDDHHLGKEGEETDDEKKKKNILVVVFRNLKEMSLDNLPNFRGFCCRGDLVFDWPSLERLEVNGCPKMSTFTATTSTTTTSGTLSTPKLKSVEINGKWEIIPQGMDLNQFLLQYHNRHNNGAAQETQGMDLNQFLQNRRLRRRRRHNNGAAQEIQGGE